MVKEKNKKYVILVGDGMGDYPLEELDGKTPLEAARTPFMDRLAAQGIMGWVQTIPSACEPGSDIANLSLMGYDPLKLSYRTGAPGGRQPGDPTEGSGSRLSLQPGPPGTPFFGSVFYGLLQRRSHLQRGGPDADSGLERGAGRTGADLLSRCQLPASAGLGRRRSSPEDPAPP